MGFLESERGIRRIKGYAQLHALIAKLHPRKEQRLAAWRSVHSGAVHSVMLLTYLPYIVTSSNH
jgi:hypothetical protein